MAPSRGAGSYYAAWADVTLLAEMVMTPFQTYTTIRYAEKLNRIEMAEATALIMDKRLTPKI